MLIANIDQLLEVCQKPLESTHSFDTEIETLLTYALVIRIYAEFEQRIAAIIAEKRNSIADLGLRAVFESSAQIRGIRFRNRSELLAALGEPYRAGWAARRAGNPRAVTFYGFIVAKRHEIAHSGAAAIYFPGSSGLV